MGDFPLDDLPLARRLALAYAPAMVRAQALSVLALDQRLSQIVHSSSEPMLAQIKLAWWRERLLEGPELWPQGEPLLAHLRSWRGATARLAELVDGWECLLADDLAEEVLHEYAQGRASAWQALARAEQSAVVLKSASDWALADLALHLGDGSGGALVRGLMESSPPRRLPREVRSLAVLHGLTRRALENGSRDILDGPAAGLVALRIGLLGR